jgi:3-oxoacyl-[acyl-carrier-protein] synthase III
LSASILAFVAERSRHAPPPPRPATWEQDQAAFARYETETVEMYEQRFGKATRIAHDVLRQLGVRDRDLDVFYAHPANAFQMRIIGTKLAALSARVPR